MFDNGAKIVFFFVFHNMIWQIRKKNLYLCNHIVIIENLNNNIICERDSNV